MVQFFRSFKLVLFFSVGSAFIFSASATVAANCIADTTECTPKALCEVATVKAGGITVWSSASDFSKHVTFAQTLGMTCGVTTSVDLCDIDVNECNIRQLCEKATSDIDGYKSWDSKAAPYVAAAKEYGMSCEVKALNFRQAYISQPKLRRQQLQYALKNLGYYFYDTDGLWGKGTSFAFDKFIAAYELQNNSEDQVFSRLLKKVTVPLSFETPKKVKSAATLIKQPPTEDNLASGEAEPISPDVEQSITKGESKVLTPIEDKIIYPVIGILKNVIKGVCVGLNAAGSGEPDC